MNLKKRGKRLYVRFVYVPESCEFAVALRWNMRIVYIVQKNKSNAIQYIHTRTLAYTSHIHKHIRAIIPPHLLPLRMRQIKGLLNSR